MQAHFVHIECAGGFCSRAFTACLLCSPRSGAVARLGVVSLLGVLCSCLHDSLAPLLASEFGKLSITPWDAAIEPHDLGCMMRCRTSSRHVFPDNICLLPRCLVEGPSHRQHPSVLLRVAAPARGGRQSGKETCTYHSGKRITHF